ncbi:DUF2922 domain-containing protein [Limosilactobacillus caviae]|jgi:hypothetical protein|uniref:DUF2922 domain-containing protein n=1 Tax=Limosilactobacillus caviae TaxID=1769424 RepID=A0ABQ2C999_9LACO|nr:DUF2922 domain-containing protein [Limosilactobacillus caviae]MRH47332.1 DUF2922 family protein [Limosilactobacillus reuteri]GGI64319.1 hypothetical protein GCM10011459_21530 [Limosilactobacillus caviae]
MITILKLKFKDSTGKNHFFKIANPKKELSKETVRQAMELMASAHLIKKGELELTGVPVGAKYVTTTEEAVYSDEV